MLSNPDIPPQGLSPNACWCEQLSSLDGRNRPHGTRRTAQQAQNSTIPSCCPSQLHPNLTPGSGELPLAPAVYTDVGCSPSVHLSLRVQAGNVGHHDAQPCWPSTWSAYMLATTLTEQPPHAQRTAELMQTAWATSAEKRLRAGQVGDPRLPDQRDVRAPSRLVTLEPREL